MKSFVKIVYILFSLFFLYYLSLPSQSMPFAPELSLQSNEPADTESPLRRAYFTNFDRTKVIEHYYSQLKTQNSFRFLTFKLNYPPEEAQTIIRDQTRSSYLEEIGHPFRESVFVNGFIPKEKKDAIFIEGKNWFQKITVRYVPSVAVVRLIVGFILICFIPLLFSEYKIALVDLKSALWGKRKT